MRISLRPLIISAVLSVVLACSVACTVASPSAQDPHLMLFASHHDGAIESMVPVARSLLHKGYLVTLVTTNYDATAPLLHRHFPEGSRIQLVFLHDCGIGEFFVRRLLPFSSVTTLEDHQHATAVRSEACFYSILLRVFTALRLRKPAANAAKTLQKGWLVERRRVGWPAVSLLVTETRYESALMAARHLSMPVVVVDSGRLHMEQGWGALDVGAGQPDRLLAGLGGPDEDPMAQLEPGACPDDHRVLSVDDGALVIAPPGNDSATSDAADIALAQIRHELDAAVQGTVHPWVADAGAVSRLVRMSWALVKSTVLAPSLPTHLSASMDYRNLLVNAPPLRYSLRSAEYGDHLIASVSPLALSVPRARVSPLLERSAAPISEVPVDQFGISQLHAEPDVTQKVDREFLTHAELPVVVVRLGWVLELPMDRIEALANMLLRDFRHYNVRWVVGPPAEFHEPYATRPATHANYASSVFGGLGGPVRLPTAATAPSGKPPNLANRFQHQQNTVHYTMTFLKNLIGSVSHKRFFISPPPAERDGVTTGDYMRGLLAHPKVRVLLSHCTPQLMQDAVRAAVVPVCLPVSADQWRTSMQAVGRGVALLAGSGNRLYRKSVDKRCYFVDKSYHDGYFNRSVLKYAPLYDRGQSRVLAQNALPDGVGDNHVDDVTLEGRPIPPFYQEISKVVRQAVADCSLHGITRASQQLQMEWAATLSQMSGRRVLPKQVAYKVDTSEAQPGVTPLMRAQAALLLQGRAGHDSVVRQIERAVWVSAGPGRGVSLGPFSAPGPALFVQDMSVGPVPPAAAPREAYLYRNPFHAMFTGPEVSLAALKGLDAFLLRFLGAVVLFLAVLRVIK